MQINNKDETIHILLKADDHHNKDRRTETLATILHYYDRLHVLSSDAPCEHNVFRHDGHTLGMKGTQVGVLEETDEVGLSSLLNRHQG